MSKTRYVVSLSLGVTCHYSRGCLLNSFQRFFCILDHLQKSASVRVSGNTVYSKNLQATCFPAISGRHFRRLEVLPLAPATRDTLEKADKKQIEAIEVVAVEDPNDHHLNRNQFHCLEISWKVTRQKKKHSWHSVFQVMTARFRYRAWDGEVTQGMSWWILEPRPSLKRLDML